MESLPDALWSLSQTAEFLGVPPGTVYDWISRGTAPKSYKIGRHRRFDPADVRSWLDARSSTGQQHSAESAT